MTQGEEKREFSRSEVALEAEIRAEAGKTVRAKLRNISMNGLLLAGEDTIAVGTACDVSVFLSTEQDVLEVRARGTVNRNDSGGIAVAFKDIDADGMEYLRNIVRYNASDVERVEEEFKNHLGIRPLEP